MRGSPDAAGVAEVHDDEMEQGHAAEAGWAQEVQKLMLHGRDREAAELAAMHLRHDLTNTESPTRGELKMGPLEQLDELEPLLGRIASGITPDQLDAPTPCADFTVRGVLGHVMGGATQFAAAFRGEPQPDVPSDIAEGPDVVERAGQALGGLTAAIRAPGALDRNVLGPFGEMPGDAFARFVVLDGLVHGWDLATATNQPYEPSDGLVAAVEGFARQAITPELRDGQTFAAATEPSEGAAPIDRLAAYTGRMA